MIQAFALAWGIVKAAVDTLAPLITALSVTVTIVLGWLWAFGGIVAGSVVLWAGAVAGLFGAYMRFARVYR